jgi:hypothetical protein
MNVKIKSEGNEEFYENIWTGSGILGCLGFWLKDDGLSLAGCFVESWKLKI